MQFLIDDCAIPTVYCGDKDIIPARERGADKYYTRKGTPRECLSKGFGAGMITEKTKTMPEKSIQRIKYVGDVYEKRFIQHNIKNVDDLKLLAKHASIIDFDAILRQVLLKKNVLDKRAYNSVLSYLYKNGMNNIPMCEKI